MMLLADGGILSQLVCDNMDCLSYIISFLDILTVLYLAYCASFRVNKGVRIFGWIWAAVVIAATITVVAIHTCMFTLVSAFFTSLVLMALFGVTFEDIATKRKAEDSSDKKETAPTLPAIPFVCPFATTACPVAQQPAPAPVKEPVKEEVYADANAPIKIEVAAAKDEPLTLKETLAIAKETKKASAVINKKYVADFLNKTFGKGVQCNMRGNFTKTNLPLADTHYAVTKEGKECFVYVYETGAAVVLLLRMSDAYAQSVRAGGHKISRSAFPKAKNAWYSIIVDDKYTEADIQKILSDVCKMTK